MSAAEIALVISSGSLLVAMFSLGWNVYRDIILKPRFRVAIRVAKIIREPHGRNLDRVLATVTNFGPGKNRAEMLNLRTAWWRRLLRRPPRYAVVIYDYQDPLSGKLPAALDVGEKVDLTFRFGPDLFLSDDKFCQIGIGDAFGRVHWCRKSEYRRAQREYRDLVTGRTKKQEASASEAADREMVPPS